MTDKEADQVSGIAAILFVVAVIGLLAAIHFLSK